MNQEGWDSLMEEDNVTKYLRVAIVLAILTMFIYALFQLVRVVEKEATIAEQNRIYNMLIKDSKDTKEYIKYLDKVGRENHK